MIIGLPILDNRIAPVFDVAREILLVNIDDGKMMPQELLILPGIAREKVIKLIDAGVTVLLCGAISNELNRSAMQCGIEVVSFLSGDIQCVLKAWLADSLNDFAMPGCRRKQGRGNGGRRRFSHGKEQCLQSTVFGHR